MAYTTINKPSDHFNVSTWTADDTSPRSLTGFGHKPDFLWGGHRNSGSTNPNVVDSTRGGNKNLTTATTAVEDSGSHGIIDSFDTDGITVSNGTNSTYPRLYYNRNNPFGGSDGGEYVYWHWKANGGTTSSNSSGTLTSTVQANTTAGFSIVTWTGSGSGNETVGHGLSSAPEMIILKPRSEARHWLIWFDAFGDNDKAFLFDEDVPADNRYGPNAPTTSVFGLYGGQGNRDTTTFVAYAFHSVQGYSKFGRFVGNNDSNGTMVYTGFKPRWIMVKNGSTNHSNHDWIIFDSKRERVNLIDTFLKGNSGEAETTSGRNQVDFLSNGFKARSSYGDFNGGSGDYFYYAAFAEHPFVTSTKIPTTAK